MAVARSRSKCLARRRGACFLQGAFLAALSPLLLPDGLRQAAGSAGAFLCGIRSVPSTTLRNAPTRRAAEVGAAAESGVVIVAGATGLTGRKVVAELLRKDAATEVVALARNATKVAESPELQSPQVKVHYWDSSDANDTEALCSGARAVVWCAEGTAELTMLANTVAKLGERPGGKPRLVMCSSAAVTRPTWSSSKAASFPGAADIPIVRLNPGDILGGKRAAEDALRLSGAPYAVVRPTGLNDKWPPGRPLLSQGDFAVGRISRADLASLLVSLTEEPEATGKTFEAVAVSGYPKPAQGYGDALRRLRSDERPGVFGRLARAFRRPFSADEATYGLLQQLLPGEEQDSAGLAMGQTYEQFDKGEEGRLGPRGEEQVPASLTGAPAAPATAR